ncbi:hypothetical protein GCM10025868_04500 [Angustibacter aerolatus]|uniref:Glycosyl transferase family 1 domain-containing protein n=1 Tax=Angustibacter aerolatus TaxID=1162965 RepID=A0ABQ6JAK4_9ACTN|nr:hypothetical protein GCM10025868_04500 [Angustibacter aerolatus]
MSAGAPVVASDLDAFGRVLDGGRLGVLFPVGDHAALARELVALLGDPARRAALSVTASSGVRRYDWSVVTEEVLAVYETVLDAGRRTAGSAHEVGPAARRAARAGAARLVPVVLGEPARPAAPPHRGCSQRARRPGSCGGPRRRSSLAASGALDPASGLLVADAATLALEAGEQAEVVDLTDLGDGRRARSESALSQALQAALDDETVGSLRHDPCTPRCSTGWSAARTGCGWPAGS